MSQRLSALYGEQDYQQLADSKKKIGIAEGVIERAYKVIFELKGDAKKALKKKPVRTLIRTTNKYFEEGIDKIEIEQKAPEKMLQRLRQDTFIFSGFKTYHQLREASSQLYDKDGNIKSFTDFYNDTAEMRDKYNKNWLKAEYNYAIRTADSAARWAQIEEDGDEYFLLYETVGDSKVRHDHAGMEGTCLPPSDPFWDIAYPPNGWNCRCSVRQVLPGRHEIKDSKKAYEAAMQATEGKAEIFRFNPGKRGQIFPPQHPYYGKNGLGHCNKQKHEKQGQEDPCAIMREIEKIPHSENRKKGGTKK